MSAQELEQIRRAYDLISAGLLYLDQNRATLKAVHGDKSVQALTLANKAVEPLQGLLTSLRGD